MENIIITNPERWGKIKEKFKTGDAQQLQVISDFDRTLTTNFIDGKKAPSLLGILREGNYLTADYSAKAQALADKYRPIEIDPLISIEEKKIAMEAWWRQHFDLLIASNLDKIEIEKALHQNSLSLRTGATEFFSFLQQRAIPLVIFSASGLGEEGIRFILKEKQLMFDNIFIVSNAFSWNEQGQALAVREPIIHSFNKDETVLQDFSGFNKIKERKNVILLGDTLGDIGMVKGLDYDNLIKIGFLNEEAEKSLEAFQQAYDLIILNDGSLEIVNNILKEIIL